MHPHRLAFAALLLAGCHAPQRAAPAPFPAGRDVGVRHVSRLAPAVAQRDVRADAGMSPVDAGRAPAAPLGDPGPCVRIECAQYEVGTGSLASLRPEGVPGAFARVAPRADVDAALAARIAEGSVRRSARPALIVRDGGTARMSTTKQQAFVEGFEIARVGADLIGDPCVATTEEGIELDVGARIGAGASTQVDVELAHTELVRPLLETRVRLAHAGAGVTVQVPLALRQELASSAELGPDEVLVLGGILGPAGAHDVLFVVGARRAESGGGGAIGRASP